MNDGGEFSWLFKRPSRKRDVLYTAIAPSVRVTGTLTKFVASLGLGAIGWSNELVEDTEDVWPNMAAGGASDRKSTRLNSSHSGESRMPSSA